MTGESEFPEGEEADADDELVMGSGGPDCERSGRVKNPTWRTLGSLTVRALRRASISDGIAA